MYKSRNTNCKLGLPVVHMGLMNINQVLCPNVKQLKEQSMHTNCISMTKYFNGLAFCLLMAYMHKRDTMQVNNRIYTLCALCSLIPRGRGTEFMYNKDLIV